MCKYDCENSMNTILNISGLWGNFGTVVMIVGPPSGTHWERIGNTFGNFTCNYNYALTPAVCLHLPCGYPT